MMFCRKDGFKVDSRSLRLAAGCCCGCCCDGADECAGAVGQPSVLKSIVETPLLTVRSICGMALGSRVSVALGRGSGSKGSLGNLPSKKSAFNTLPSRARCSSFS
jgi:hypothetical protein